MGAFSNMDYELQNSEATVSDAFTEDDANGNIVKAVDAEGNATTYVYDALDRLASYTNAEAIPSPSSMTMRETRFLLTATAIPPAIPTMD